MDQPRPLLSVIIPVFNEERTVGELLRRVLDAPYRFPEKEVIIIDDGSTDGTPAVLAGWTLRPGLVFFRHPRNCGKGAAVRTGLAGARGDIVLIQDADLEYDPEDYPRLVEPIRQGAANVVYGSRYLCPVRPLPWSKFRVAVCLVNGLVRVLYGRRLTDEATCYKALPADLARGLRLRSDRFELCAEITAKLCRFGVAITEVPVSYRPRTTTEGKKICWRDAWSTFLTLCRWRFAPLPSSPCPVGFRIMPPGGAYVPAAEAVPPLASR